MSVLSLIVIFRAIPRIKNYKSEPKINTEVISRPKLSIIIFIITLIFIGVLDFNIQGFLPSGILYMTLVGYLMTHRDLKRLPYVVCFSVILTVSSFYIFTKFFYIDLP